MTTVAAVETRNRPVVSWELLMLADEAGLRLEIVDGVPLWEPAPAVRHQSLSFQIQTSIEPVSQPSSDMATCGCHHYADVYVRFPDGSIKRPDISIFCRVPDELDESITLLPEAVIEILSRGFEAKDLDFGLPFYLAQGVKDVVIVSPHDFSVLHARGDERRRLEAPVTIDLLCGCRVTVPRAGPDAERG
jgi:Uma2 family endonuclease